MNTVKRQVLFVHDFTSVQMKTGHLIAYNINKNCVEKVGCCRQ